MATPNYKGAGQPSSSGGSWLSWLGGTPGYKGKRGTAAGNTGAGPAYKPAPDATQSPDAMTSSAEQIDACGGGPIAIVIPREVIEQQ